MSGPRDGRRPRGSSSPRPGADRSDPPARATELPTPAPRPVSGVARPTPADGLSGVGGGVRIGRGRRRPIGNAIARVGIALAVAFAALAGGAGYWQVVESPPLSAAPDNPAVIVAARNAVRGDILDRTGVWLARTKTDDPRGPYRVYRSNTLSPVIGYASRQFGTAGLERAYDAELVGLRRPDPVADLLKKFERDATDPQTLRLTISLALQQAAVKALGDRRGAIVILEPDTGRVLALASTPIFDANAVADPTGGPAAFERLRTDETQPLLPRATQGRYVPGSVFKIVTALAALGTGAVTPGTRFEEQPAAERTGLLVSGFRVRDGHHTATGGRALNFPEATEVSCNIWYALAGLETGGEGLVEMAARVGFGAPLPFDLPTAPSQVTNGDGGGPGGFADNVELANAAYGQAETLVTPLQMALVAATVANDGVLMRPRLIDRIIGRDGTRQIAPEQVRRVVSPDVAGAIASAMQRAVEGRLGRVFTAGADVPGVETAGKSGTAELGGQGEPHSWFIGFAPVEAPRVAIAVLVERAGRGAEVAAPIAGQMMEAALNELDAG